MSALDDRTYTDVQARMLVWKKAQKTPLPPSFDPQEAEARIISLVELTLNLLNGDDDSEAAHDAYGEAAKTLMLEFWGHGFKAGQEHMAATGKTIAKAAQLGEILQARSAAWQAARVAELTAALADDDSLDWDALAAHYLPTSAPPGAGRLPEYARGVVNLARALANGELTEEAAVTLAGVAIGAGYTCGEIAGGSEARRAVYPTIEAVHSALDVVGKHLSALEDAVYYASHAQGIIVYRTPGEDELYS